MGRGRAKAKQQKVARELKYNSHHTDLDALQRELGNSAPSTAATARFDPDVDGDTGVDEADGADWARSRR
jgi:hypothetical protein